VQHNVKEVMVVDDTAYNEFDVDIAVVHMNLNFNSIISAFDFLVDFQTAVSWTGKTSFWKGFHKRFFMDFDV
jgi:hypothetical protein